MVRALHDQTGIGKLQADVIAQIGDVVNRADGKVAALIRGLVRQVSTLFVTPRVPGTLDRVDFVEAAILTDFVANIVKDVELGLRSEESGVSDSRAGEILLGLMSNLTGVTAIDFTVARVVNVKEHDDCFFITERIHVRGGDIRNQLQV